MLMRPRALLVGGTSNWAKEILLRWALQEMAHKDKVKKELLVREIAEPLDVSALARNGVDVQSEFITSGCFCCTSKIDLEMILRECNQGKLPNHIVIETPITADLVAVKKILATEMKGVGITSLFVVENETYFPLMETFPDLMQRNLRVADAVVLAFKGEPAGLKAEEMDAGLGRRKTFATELEGSSFRFLIDPMLCNLIDVFH